MWCVWETFSVKAYLTEHVSIHTGEKPYKCETCERPFLTAGSLRKHLKIYRKREAVQMTNTWEVRLHIQSYHQFPQEGINHSLVAWLGKVDYMLMLMYQVIFVLHSAMNTVVHVCTVFSGMENKEWSHKQTLWLQWPRGDYTPPNYCSLRYLLCHVIS